MLKELLINILLAFKQTLCHHEWGHPIIHFDLSKEIHVVKCSKCGSLRWYEYN